MKYQGSCHCGNIKFEVEGEIKSGLACNCSMCQRKGSLLWFVPRHAMRLLTPEENASSYLFNKHKITHRFCATCGIHPYATSSMPTGEPMAAINLRCLEEIDLEAIPVTHYDGRSV
ncbi:GFA family protein [Massilia endophytica]|uniref:GFA family protein n=1 Tax=Massilia endophytica TaxID=2899220 RepID=UPI001E5C872F|nr:GFA family protein [Massilia endophytica]UGQ48600.1 GFA family protein [Massilia endophytica]